MTADTMESAAADAVAAPLDLLLTDAALGALNRVNPGGSGIPSMVEPDAFKVGMDLAVTPGRWCCGPKCSS